MPDQSKNEVLIAGLSNRKLVIRIAFFVGCGPTPRNSDHQDDMTFLPHGSQPKPFCFDTVIGRGHTRRVLTLKIKALFPAEVFGTFSDLHSK